MSNAKDDLLFTGFPNDALDDPTSRLIMADAWEDAGDSRRARLLRNYVKSFGDLVGHTIVSISNDEDISFELSNGLKCKLYHEQDCCESVNVDSVDGDLQSIVGSPLVEAVEAGDDAPPPPSRYTPESYTWTVYTLATQYAKVVIRWFGESNGYYSEDVRFVAIAQKEIP